MKAPRLKILALSILAALAVYFAFKPSAPQTFSYGSEPSQVMDIYRAPGINRPAILLIHSGAWAVGSRHDVAKLATYLADHGITAIAIDYRLTTDGAKWSDIKQDATSAMWFIREHAKELDIDPKRVCAMGNSAGGQMAAYLGTTDEVNDNGTHSHAKCVITWGAPWNLKTMNNDYAKNAVERLIRDGDAKDASPLFSINADTAPVMLVHGTSDQMISVLQSRKACDVLKAAGVKCELLLLENEGHTTIVDPKNQKLFNDVLEDFLRENL